MAICEDINEDTLIDNVLEELCNQNEICVDISIEEEPLVQEKQINGNEAKKMLEKLSSFFLEKIPLSIPKIYGIEKDFNEFLLTSINEEKTQSKINMFFNKS